jgi:hypothetical protein
MTVDELNALVDRIFDAHSLHELLHGTGNHSRISRSRLAVWADRIPLAPQRTN